MKKFKKKLAVILGVGLLTVTSIFNCVNCQDKSNDKPKEVAILVNGDLGFMNFDDNAMKDCKNCKKFKVDFSCILNLLDDNDKKTLKELICKFLLSLDVKNKEKNIDCKDISVNELADALKDKKGKAKEFFKLNMLYNVKDVDNFFYVEAFNLKNGTVDEFKEAISKCLDLLAKRSSKLGEFLKKNDIKRFLNLVEITKME